jgi:hypothetical protein
MDPKKKGHNVDHNRDSDGFHVSKWENEGEMIEDEERV